MEMFKEINGKDFLVVVEQKGILKVKILAVVVNEYFDEEGYVQSLNERGSIIPGMDINNKNVYLSMIASSYETGEVLRVTEHELFYDCSMLLESQIEKIILDFRDNQKIEEIKVKFGDSNFDKHYLKCLDFGMDEKESLMSLKKFIEHKIKGIKKKNDE